MWYNDVRLLTGFGKTLCAAGVLEDSDDFTAYLDSPQRWSDEFDSWAECGYPTETDDGWGDFLNSFDGDESDDDDDDDDEE
jgi:hypothetical protein